MSSIIRIFAALVVVYNIFVPTPQLAKIGAVIALAGLTASALNSIDD